MPSKVEQIICPSCKEVKFDEIIERCDGLKIVRCLSCGLAYLNPRPVPEEIYKLYEEGYYTGKIDKEIGYAGHSGSIHEIKYYCPYGFDILLEETKLNNKRVLDIGCSFGKFVYWMRKAGANAVGIDISEESTAWGRKKLSLDLRKETLESLDEQDSSFDVITMIDIIEHIVDLDGFMSKLSSLIKPGGLVFVQTPNFESYEKWHKQWRYLYTGLEHILFFDSTSIDKIFAKYDMFPSRETSVFCTIACDKDTYFKNRGSIKNKLRSILLRLPDCFSFVHLLLSKFFISKHVYRCDTIGKNGAIIIGCYRKKNNN
ncbi:MAG TPA: methyltransferase domain-containing protein [bacterium]|nr:methyltransferase domain-containing protein [bacterium]